MLDVREHLQGDGQLCLDVAIVGVCHGTWVLVVLVEGPAPQVMDCETEDDHLEGFGGRVVVLRFNYFSNFGPDESGPVRTVNMLTALTGILRRIEDGETTSDIEVFHVHFAGDPPNFPPDLQLKAPYLLAKDTAPCELQNIPKSRTQPGTPPRGATSGISVVYTGW
jgi:hypothetical protein